MDVLYFLAALILIRRLNKRFKFTPLYTKWHALFNVAGWVIILLYIAVQIAFENWVDSLIGAALLAGIVFYADREEDFRPWRKTFTVVYPLAAVGVIAGITGLVAGNFYEKYHGWFDIAVAAAFVWMFARWAASRKQEEELKLAAVKNTELEKLVTERTAEITKQKEELEETLKELRTTQAQLIQSEKMASLGELTAGIAHEIQNPLNFVNNFSDVSAELIDEMEEELTKGDIEEARAIAGDIKQNLEKIRHHGQRADGIVKGMLQHSRASSNVKEPTDVNKLTDEYFRLAYHGLRAKDKSFNAELITNFAEKLPAAEMVPQDIGRVLLNLFNNAFYAVQKKQAAMGDGFKPTVEVDTALKGKHIEIVVKDNGTGIPDDIREKIMQPFFTTKPTGQGTGLGLSLSYDIVVKAHNGKIDVKSKDGEGSEFRISIPV
ncbi:MAG TPA: ATP-binding protein [Mucilaginibacter sp.]|nr:ATP-binding protein [Mucilaginibacter sp.]